VGRGIWRWRLPQSMHSPLGDGFSRGRSVGGPIGGGGGPVGLFGQAGQLGYEIEERDGLRWRFQPKWLRN
jgi:hypothetical protein